MYISQNLDGSEIYKKVDIDETWKKGDGFFPPEYMDFTNSDNF